MSHYNTILQNTVNNNFYGIYLYFSDYNAILENVIMNNDYGIASYSSNYNIILGNIVKDRWAIDLISTLVKYRI